MNTNSINIDRIVDYRAEYGAEIKKHKISGNEMIGLCPFHGDSNPSFTINLSTGQFECKACGKKGNYTTFYAELHGMETKDAYKAILEKYGVADDDWKPDTPKKYTVAEYAFMKRIPEQWLKETCFLEDGKDRDGRGYVKIPYLDAEKKTVTYRKRYSASGKDKFRWKYGTKINTMYGEWRIKEIQELGYTVLVEGESDTQTLWHLDIPGLGVPGASCFRPEFIDKLEGMKIYIHVEPDQGGQAFLKNVTTKLKDFGYTGEVYQFSCKVYGKKDPSDLYIAFGEQEAREKLDKAIKQAKFIDLEHLDEAIPESVKGIPLNLRIPEPWLLSDKGMHLYNPKSDTYDLICRTPIIISHRFKNWETREEKMEIAFYRDAEWERVIFPRSTIFQSKSITCLADLGCTVTSENAKQVVSFLSALEAENMDIIPRAESTSSMGWQTKGRFLPGHGDDIVLDIEPSLRGWANAYEVKGDFEKWKETMAPHRERDKFRFILAASFTAPLLKIINQRIFFVYNWGNSKGGKTSGLKAALSVWGDPEKLMVNFNATQVALERMAGFYCDLPLGIDERQLAGNNQGSLEKIVYMLASGTGRARGSKGGGLQEMRTWRTVALATGEEPISTDTSQTGISSRILEIYGGPFNDEKSASLMHQMAGMNCGWAGPYFIKKIMEVGSEEIKQRFEKMLEYVYVKSNGENGSHAASIAAVATADALIDVWIFGSKSGERSENRAKTMADYILGEQQAADAGDVNEHAVQYIVDWVLSNQNYFGSSAMGTCLGFMNDGCAYIYPTTLNNALTKAGYSPRKTLKYMADQGYIGSWVESGKTLYSRTKYFDGKKCRMVEFKLSKFTKDADFLADEEDNVNSNRPMSAGEFAKVPENMQEKLPFD